MLLVIHREISHCAHRACRHLPSCAAPRVIISPTATGPVQSGHFPANRATVIGYMWTGSGCPFTGCRELGQLMAGSGGSQGLPAMAVVMASSVVTPWAAVESR